MGSSGALPVTAAMAVGMAGNLLTTGEETFLRDALGSATLSTTSGILRLSYWTARKTESSTQVRVYTGGTAAGATPTVCRMGVYSLDPATGNGTLAAAIANDTTLFAAGTTAYTRSLTSTFSKVAGTRYAFGLLVVTGATAPTMVGEVVGSTAEFAVAPPMSASLPGQSDLPASFTAGSLSTSSSRIYAAILP